LEKDHTDDDYDIQKVYKGLDDSDKTSSLFQTITKLFFATNHQVSNYVPKECNPRALGLYFDLFYAHCLRQSKVEWIRTGFLFGVEIEISLEFSMRQNLL